MCIVLLGLLNRMPQTGRLQKHSFLTVLEAGKSKINLLTDLVPGEDSCGLGDGYLLHESSYGKERALVSPPLLIRALILCIRASPLGLHLTMITFS